MTIWRDRQGRAISEWTGAYRDRRMAFMRDVLERFDFRDKYDGAIDMIRTAESAEEAVELSALASKRLGIPATELWLSAMNSVRAHAHG
jgi:hypothetical protein